VPLGHARQANSWNFVITRTEHCRITHSPNRRNSNHAFLHFRGFDLGSCCLAMADYFVGSQGIEFPGRTSKCASKIVMDPIQGLMKIDGIFAEIVDTPQFQRLRDLKQLGSAYFIFPGASHNRFEHSLGVAHLSKIWANKFRTDQPELGCSERQVDLVGLAGLCHDLGHGPFSHVFDNEFIPSVRPNATWKHEQMSVKLLEHCIEKNSIDLGDFISPLVLSCSHYFCRQRRSGLYWRFDYGRRPVESKARQMRLFVRHRQQFSKQCRCGQI
jgi:hypothetical protein